MVLRALVGAEGATVSLAFHPALEAAGLGLGFGWHEVQSVKVVPYTGWVYDAESVTSALVINRTLVRNCGLTSHDDSRKVNGMIVPTSVAAANPIGHPNCTRSWLPRPDLDPLPGEEARDVFSFDPTPTAAQLADQEAATRARRAPRTPRQRRASTRRLLDARSADDTIRVQNAADAAQAAAQLARQQRAAAAGRASATARVARSKANELARWDVTPDEWVDAGRQVQELRRQFRALALDVEQDMLALLGQADLIKRPPNLVRTVDRFTGRQRKIRRLPDGTVSNEYEWFDQLSGPEQRRVRRYFGDAGIDPDAVGRAIGASDAKIDEAMAQWVEITAKRDTARAVASGRQSTGAVEMGDVFGDTQLAAEMAEQGIDLNALLGASLDDATGQFAAAQNDLMGRYAAEVLERRTSRPAPWTMSLEAYSDELAAFEATGVRGIAEKAATGGALSDREAYVVARWGELVPSGLDVDGGADAVTLWQRLRRVAQLGGLSA